MDLLHSLVVGGLQCQLKSNTVDDKKALEDEIMLLKDARKPEVIRLSLRRKSLWSDYSKARKSSYDPSHPIKITFCGEQAIDDGGPRREFFSGIMLTYHILITKLSPVNPFFLLVHNTRQFYL